MSEKQTTLNKEISLKGKGLHTGVDVSITMKPARADFGYKFKRTDIEKENLIPELKFNKSEEDLLEYPTPDLKRCTCCVLPETMPYISFDSEGVCNYCRN